MKKLIKTICIVIALITVYKTISFGVDKIVQIGKDAKARTEQQLNSKSKTESEPVKAEVKEEEKPQQPIETNKVATEKTFKDKIKEGPTEFAITNDFYKLYHQESTLKTTTLKDICRNENDYKGKMVYLPAMKVTETKNSDEGELLVCHDNVTNMYMYLIYDYSQYLTKYVVGDEITTVGRIDSVADVDSMYIPRIYSSYVFESKYIHAMLTLYDRLGTDKYEIRPGKDIPSDLLFDVFKLDNKEKAENRILVQHDKWYYWIDSKLQIVGSIFDANGK